MRGVARKGWEKLREPASLPLPTYLILYGGVIAVLAAGEWFWVAARGGGGDAAWPKASLVAAAGMIVVGIGAHVVRRRRGASSS